MKKKVIIIVALIAILALGGTIAFAAVDGEGNLVNPFTNRLSDKVGDGTITQDEANIFTKVLEAIRGDREDGEFGHMMGRGRFGENKPFEHPEIDSELMEEMREAIEGKTQEVLDKLVTDGVLDAEIIEEAGEHRMNLMFLLKDSDEETIATLKAAFEEIKTYRDEFIEGKVADGTLTQEEADFMMKMGPAGERSFPGRMPCEEGNFQGRPGMRSPSGGYKRPAQENEDPST